MGLVVILASTVVAMCAVAQLWEDEWEVLLISLQVSEVGKGQGRCLPRTFATGELLSLLCLHTKAQRSREGSTEQASQCPQPANGDRIACLVGRDGQQHAGDLRGLDLPLSPWSLLPLFTPRAQHHSCI